MSMRSAFQTGKAPETLVGRAEWYNSEEQRMAAGKTIEEWRAMGNCKGFLAPGVIENADGTFRPNDIPIDPQTYWESV